MLKTVSSITNAIGALNYKGTWNASTNIPALTDGTGTKGDYYVVSTGGTQTFNGIQFNFGVGDWIVYNGAIWQRVEGGADGNFTTVTVNAGTVGAPSITTTGDPNTGVFFPAADTIAFAEGGVEVIRINSSGNVGIGTTTPRTRFNMSVAATANYPALGTANDGFILGNPNNSYGLNMGVSGSGYSWMQAMRFDGAATPYTLYAQPAGGKFNIGGSTTAEAYIVEIAGAPITARTSTRPILNLYNSTEAFSVSPYTGLTFTARYDAAANTTDLAFIGGGKENGTDGNFAGYLKFNTRTNGSADIVERMRISSTGGVSIGNTTDRGAGSLNVSGLIYPQQATTAGAPAYVKGAIYFDTTLNKLRVGGATAWETITSV